LEHRSKIRNQGYLLNMKFLDNSQTNWLYIFLVGLCAFIAGAGVMMISHWWLKGIGEVVVVGLSSKGELAEELNPREGFCLESGGRKSVALFCEGWEVESFPNTCFYIPDTCSGKEVEICDCGAYRCFDGDKCVDLKPEEELDRLTADLKGNNQTQLAVLTRYVADTSKDKQPVSLLEIYAGSDKGSQEWISSFFLLGIGGSLSVAHNFAIDKPVIMIESGMGASSTMSLYFYWDGFQFQEMGVFGGNVIVLGDDGAVHVYSTNYDCPFAEGIESIYGWDGAKYRLVETIDSGCPPVE